jgi:hypothetical protein
MTRLSQPGPIRANDLDTLRVQTSRLAEFLDRMDAELPPDLLVLLQSEKPQRPS